MLQRNLVQGDKHQLLIGENLIRSYGYRLAD